MYEVDGYFSIYQFLFTFFAGFCSYFWIAPQVNPQKYPVEHKLAHYGGLLYMIASPLLFIAVNLLT